MGNNKILVAGLAGAVTLFILGWIIYGMLLMDFMAANAGSATGVNKSEDEMSFLWIIIGNLASGYLFAVIFGKYGNINTAMAGIQAGALIGLLMGVGVDAVMYATTNMMNMTAMCADVACWIVMSAITGGVVAGVLGMGNKTATA